MFAFVFLSQPSPDASIFTIGGDTLESLLVI